MLRNRLIICVLLLLCGLSAAARGSREESATQLHVAGLKGPSSIGMLPFFNNPPSYDGVEFSFAVADEPQIMTARILSGEVDIAAVPINLAAVLYNKGVSLKIAAVIGNGVIHVVSSDPALRSILDLKGRRIYCIAKGSNPEYILKYVLEGNGIDPDNDVTLDFSYDHSELGAQLAAGNVETGILPEPFVTIVGMKNPAVKPRIDLQNEFGTLSGFSSAYPATALVVLSSVYKHHSEAVERFLDDYALNLEMVIGDPSKTGLLAEEFLGLPAPVIGNSLPRLNLVFNRISERRTELESFFKILYGYSPGAIGGMIPDEAIYP